MSSVVTKHHYQLKVKLHMCIGQSNYNLPVMVMVKNQFSYPFRWLSTSITYPGEQFSPSQKLSDGDANKPLLASLGGANKRRLPGFTLSRLYPPSKLYEFIQPQMCNVTKSRGKYWLGFAKMHPSIWVGKNQFGWEEFNLGGRKPSTRVGEKRKTQFEEQ